MREEIENLLREAAVQELMPRFRHVSSCVKHDGSLLTEADTATQAFLQQELAARFDQIPLLGEEMEEAEQEALIARSDEGLWVLDPLDGTSNFAAGLPFFAISLGLLRHSKMELGVVYDPVRDECFSAVRGEGAWCNGVPLRVPEQMTPLAQGIGIVDFKRLPAILAQRIAAAPPFSSQRSFGSVALDWCQLAAGRVHVYLHGRSKLWDYGAGELIFREAGGFTSTLEGEAILVPSLRPRSAVAAPTQELFTQWSCWLAERQETCPDAPRSP